MFRTSVVSHRTLVAAFCMCFGLPLNAASLLDLSPPDGGRMIGLGASDETSRAINYIGDINGDGRTDIAIGAPLADRMPNDSAGKLYVVFGSAVPFSTRDFSPASLNGSNGFTIVGASAAQFGSSVVGLPDFNGDLLPDFVVGARFTSIYVFYGKTSYPAVIDLVNPPVGYGFQITASSSGTSTLGVSVSSGNFNNDTFGDIVVTQYEDAQNNLGRVSLVFGQSGGVPSTTVDIDALNNASSPRVAVITGPANGSRFGFAVHGMSDFNGDGIGDVAIGAPFADAQNGRAYVVFGRANANATTLGFSNTQAIGSLTTATGMEFTAVLTGGRLGTSVASGDLLQDNRPDLIIGAQTASANSRTQSGSVYVVFGKANNAPSFSRPISDLMVANQGFSVDGAAGGNFTGTAVGSPGDINRDGPADLVIGAHGATVAGNAAAGQFYIIYGSRNTFPVTTDLASMTPQQGVLWTGETAQAAVGFSIATQRGDFNGDGRADVLVGGLRVDTTATDAGAGYLLLDNRTRYMADGFEDPG